MAPPAQPLQAQPFLIPDCRRPGEPMAALPLKLPQAAAAQLQATAERLGCSRTALGRALLLQGLALLQAPASEVAQ
jgi:hypothetical protein